MTTLNGVEFTRTGNPQADLVTYAKARGIDEAQAKEELEAEFGVAKAINESKDEEVALSNDSTDTSSLSTEDFLKGFVAKLLSLLGLDASKLEETSSTTEDTEETSSTTEDTEETSSTSSSSSSSCSSTSSDDDEESTTTSSSSSSSSSTTDTSSSQATDRKNLQNEIKEWSAKLKQATDAGDQWGITKAQEVLKDLQTRAYEWDKKHFGF